MLKEGIALSQNTLDVIESTFSLKSARDVQGALADPDRNDKETLVNFLFFPDEAFQSALEPFIENTVFEQEDVNRLAHELTEMTPFVRYIFPDNEAAVSFSMSFSEIKQFIYRLNLLKSPDSRLVEAIFDQPDKGWYFSARVKLRNARVIFSDRKIQWLALFLTKITSEYDDDLKMLDFAVAFLEQVDDKKDYFDELVRLKRSLMMSLDLYQRFADQLKSNNMETLMLRGIRVPSVNKEEAVNNITIIDDICNRMYGKTSPDREPVQDRDLGEYGGTDGLKDMIRLLS